MNISLTEKIKYSARCFLRHMIIASVFVTMYLTACNGSDTVVLNEATNSFGINLPLISKDLDLALIVLNPQDMSDLFSETTYSINQAITSPVSKGENVIYPTQILAHTTAFAEGFSTRIEIFSTIEQAVKSYDSTLRLQSGDTLETDLLGDDSRSFVRSVISPEGFDLNTSEYTVLFHERNAVGLIILRTTKTVSPKRLSQLTELVIDRLQP